MKFYVVNLDNNTIAIDGFGAYFGDETLDTIKYCKSPLTYLNPQIQNTTGNIINDTLRWTLISGTFVASGNEKYMVLGNFKSNASTNTLMLNPAALPALATDIFFDDVSVIELDLPAYAGKDTSVFSGAPVFLGRNPDVGIDEACMWYKLPATITPTTPALDTIAGIWVNPTVTSTYVVRQEICSLVKWDTVTVHIDAVGFDKLTQISNQIKLYPIPATNHLEVIYTDQAIIKGFSRLRLYNALGQVLKEEELMFTENTASINLENIESGAYTIILSNSNNETITKKLLIAK